MKKEKKDLLIASSMLMVGVIVVGVIGMFMFGYVVTYISDEQIAECRDEINNQENVSDEYRDGWNDCLDYFEEVRQQATNLSMLMD